MSLNDKGQSLELLDDHISIVDSASVDSDRETKEYLQSVRKHDLDKLGLENQRLEMENSRVDLENEQFKDNKDARKKWTSKIFYLVGGYLLVATTLMCVNHHWYFHIDDNVMMTFLGTTVVNTIGLLMGVVRYLFPATK